MAVATPTSARRAIPPASSQDAALLAYRATRTPLRRMLINQQPAAVAVAVAVAVI
jgi:hypothetical protein